MSAKAYLRSYSFSGYQATNPAKPLPGPSLDNELDNIAQAIGGTQRNLALIQRSDGALKNGIVTNDALAPRLWGDITAAGNAAAAEAKAQAAIATNKSVVATNQAGIATNQAHLASVARSSAASWARQPYGEPVTDDPEGRSALHYADVSHQWATEAKAWAELVGVMIYDFNTPGAPVGDEDWNNPT